MPREDTVEKRASAIYASVRARRSQSLARRAVRAFVAASIAIVGIAIVVAVVQLL